jgi:predicted DNA-binding transcriptional regulator YafY
MTFGDKAEVLEPQEARERIAGTVKRMAAIYEKEEEA